MRSRFLLSAMIFSKSGGIIDQARSSSDTLRVVSIWLCMGPKSMSASGLINQSLDIRGNLQKTKGPSASPPDRLRDVLWCERRGFASTHRVSTIQAKRAEHGTKQNIFLGLC